MFCCRSIDSRGARPVLGVLVVGLAVLFGTMVPPVRAQVDATLVSNAALTSQQRQELQETLKHHAQVLEAQATVVKTVAKLIGPTVVHIEADEITRGRAGSSQIEENGSGVIIQLGENHYVLTNRHVVRNSAPASIRVNLADGRQLHPTKIWADPDSDVAVLAVSGENLEAAPVGDSSRMEIGDFVLAVGSPFGLSHSVTFGIVSAKGRRDLRLGDDSVRFQDFLQTDAAINPGNSGGPLINLRGEVIGINTAIASNSGGNDGIGFAIPINMFMIISKQLIERGKVTRAFLGVTLDRSFGPAMAAEAGLPFPTGARVNGITRGTPADKVHLQVGDIILQFNGTNIEDDDHLVNLVGLTKVGTKVPLVIFRDRKSITLDVVVGDRADFSPPN